MFWILIWSVGLIYVGMLMVIDPAGFDACMRRTSAALHAIEQRLQQRLQGNPWWPPLAEQYRAPVSPRKRGAIRLAGVLLAALGAVNLAALFGRLFRS